MTSRPPVPEHERVPAKVAEQLLARASELDANSAALSELRRAATEAGISSAAFDAALEEYRADGRSPREPVEPRVAPGRAPRKFLVVSIAALIVGALGYAAMRIVPSSVRPVDPFQSQITLGCLTPQAASNEAWKILDRNTSTVSMHRGSPGAITVSAPSQELLDRVREAIAQQERSVGCALPPAR